jgi:glutamine cyclotransferase
VAGVRTARTFAKPPRYTQGLFFHGDLLYESSGLYGKSQINVWQARGESYELAAGICLPAALFAEGAALAEGSVSVLTWRENTVLRLTPTLQDMTDVFLPGQGWGLTYDGSRLWRSDGSERLQAHDPFTYAPAGPPLAVRDGAKTVRMLNELEWDPRTGLVFANIYLEDRVAAIDTETGEVRFWLDFAPVAAPVRARLGEPDAVLNGLAFDADGRLWATGKMWDVIYEMDYGLPDGTAGRELPRNPAPPPPEFPDEMRSGCRASP